MKKIIFSILLVFIITDSFSQCVNADSLYTDNITYLNALANWSSAPTADHYMIHYRELNTTTWSNLQNITGSDTTRNIPQLQSSTTYEWQIKTFCDTSNQPNSGWSYSDTFTTAAFVPAPFNPSILPIIDNLTCNMNTAFAIVAQQTLNEPDIASSIFSSDKGYFEISTLSSGDVLGNASYTSSFLNFTASLVLDFTLGPNYAKIDMIDTSGATMGFFIIENLTPGVKISSIGPNDGNNYTNGYMSQLNFTDLFVNPNEAGPITFTATIDSELGDNINFIDSSIIISCEATIIKNVSGSKELIKIVDLLGRELDEEGNKILFYLYSDGTVEKKIIIE
tara:strand:- start:102 stop:1112 length:1011 start_codon:yes stop_codon:yes gene_type:complete